MKNMRIDRPLLMQLTDPSLERNIYVHPNGIARDIFWQRLEELCQMLDGYADVHSRVLDLGGGSGVFGRMAAGRVASLDVIDLDARDARALKAHFGLPNVNVIEKDIRHYFPDQLYDVVTAADVLEHFAELQCPISFIQRVLRPGGSLLISVPTENWIYELGRLVIRKTKPVDHFHTGRFIVETLRQHGFQLKKRTWAPKMLFRIPLFEIAVFRWPGMAN